MAGLVRRVFVSHSHADRPLAEALATALRERGVDAWFDKWEVAPGDSLVQKIFEEGLKDCALFIVLLSPASVTSKWVAHELDVALVRRIEQTTRVVPVVVREAAIPEALKPLRRLDATTGIDRVVAELVDLAFGRWDARKPPLGTAPHAQLRHEMVGFSYHASAVAMELAPGLLHPQGWPPSTLPQFLAAKLHLDHEQLGDAVDELERAGLVETHAYMGCAPFTFNDVEPTYRLGHAIGDPSVLGYDPVRDVLVVASHLAQAKEIDGPSAEAATGLSPPRLNRAAEYLKDHRLALVGGALGTAPYTFYNMVATPDTRRFVRANAK